MRKVSWISIAYLGIVCVFCFVEPSASQVFDMSCDIRSVEGELVAKLPVFRPVLTTNELGVPHPTASELQQALVTARRQFA